MPECYVFFLHSHIPLRATYLGAITYSPQLCSYHIPVCIAMFPAHSEDISSFEYSSRIPFRFPTTYSSYLFIGLPPFWEVPVKRSPLSSEARRPSPASASAAAPTPGSVDGKESPRKRAIRTSTRSTPWRGATSTGEAGGGRRGQECGQGVSGGLRWRVLEGCSSERGGEEMVLLRRGQ